MGSLYDGRNRSFFMVSYEGVREVLGDSRLGRVPTTLEAAADFSASVDRRGRPVFVRDPLLGGPCNRRNQQACFPGNLIPAGRLNPVGETLMGFYPRPNRDNLRNNYLTVGSRRREPDTFTLKIDHHLTNRDTLAFRYQKNYFQFFNPFSGSGLLEMWGNEGDDRKTLAGLTYTRTFSPSFLMEAQGGVSRSATLFDSRSGGRDVQAEFGIPVGTTDPDLVGFPFFRVRQHFNLGPSQSTPNQAHSTRLSEPPCGAGPVKLRPPPCV